jgi:hypothetical protein
VDTRDKRGHDDEGRKATKYHRAMHKGGWVYLMTNRRNGTLTLGVTSDLARRTWEHRESLIDGFTRQYGLTRLVWYEWHDDIAPRDPARDDHEALAPRLEGPPHPQHEPGLGRSL